MQKFNQRLRTLREKVNLSQQKFADIIGVSKSSINMYERGDREPNFEKLEKFADFFNVDMDYILGKSDIENKMMWLKNIDHTIDFETLRHEVLESITSIDIIKKEYGEKVANVFSMYTLLDVEDRAEIRGCMKQLLKQDKYLSTSKIQTANSIETTNIKTEIEIPEAEYIKSISNSAHKTNSTILPTIENTNENKAM